MIYEFEPVLILMNVCRAIFIFRFSSGDLSSECDDVDPNDPTGTPRVAAAAPLQQQPLPNPSGGPPNMPPPPAPTRGNN